MYEQEISNDLLSSTQRDSHHVTNSNSVNYRYGNRKTFSQNYLIKQIVFIENNLI